MILINKNSTRMYKIAVVLSFMYSYGIAQSKEISIRLDTNGLYYQVLKLHFTYVEEMYKFGGNKIKEPYEANVAALPGVTEFLPRVIGNFNVSYLDSKEMIDKGKRKSSFYLININPIEVNSDTISIKIIDYDASFRKNKWNFINTGGSIFKYKFNCSLNKFELVQMSQKGL